MKIHDLGVPLFLETPISSPCRIRFFHFQAMWSRLYRRWDRGRGGTVCEHLGWNEPETIKLGSQQSTLLRTICRRSNRNIVDKVLPKYHPDRPVSLPNSRFFSYLWTFIFGTCLNNAAETLQLHQAECHPPKSQGKSSSATATTECETHHRRNSQGEVWSISPRLQEQLNCKTVLKCGETYGDVTVRSFEDFQRFPHTVQN